MAVPHIGIFRRVEERNKQMFFVIFTEAGERWLCSGVMGHVLHLGQMEEKALGPVSVVSEGRIGGFWIL